MATAQILINSISTSVESLSIGDAVVLTNSDNTGLTTWQWSFLDRPAGSSASLSTPTTNTSGFTVDREGSYLIKLVVNGGAASDTSVAAALTSLSGLRIPAAKERLESNTSRGWAATLNSNQLQFEREIRAGAILSARSTGAIAIGVPVKITGSFTLPDGSIIPTISAASATTAINLPAIGVTTTAAGGSGIVVKVRTSGILAEITMDTSLGAVNDPVYVSNAGTLSLSAGTTSYIIGHVATVNASGHIVVTPSMGSTAGVGGGISGSGAAGRVTYFDGVSSVTGSANLLYSDSGTPLFTVNGDVRFNGVLLPDNLPGTSGQVLTSNGSSTTPTWQTPSGGGSLATLSSNGLMPTTVFQQLSETEADGMLTGGAQSISTSNVVVAAYTLLSNGDKYSAGGATTVAMPNGVDQYIYWNGTAIVVGTRHQALNTIGNIPICYVPTVTLGVIVDGISDIRRFVNKIGNKILLTIGAQPTSTDLGQADFYSLQSAIDWARAARASGMMKNIEFRIISSIELSETVIFNNLANVKFSAVKTVAVSGSSGVGVSDNSIIWKFDTDPVFALSGSSNLTFDGLHFDGDIVANMPLAIFSGSNAQGITITNCSIEPYFNNPPTARIGVRNFIFSDATISNWTIKDNHIYAGENGIIVNGANNCTITGNNIYCGPGRDGGLTYGGDYGISLGNLTTAVVNDCIISANRIDGDPTTILSHPNPGFRVGIYAAMSSNLLLNNNNIRHNTAADVEVVDIAGILFDQAHKASISNNTILIESGAVGPSTESFGIAIVASMNGSDSVTINSNIVYNNSTSVDDHRYCGAMTIKSTTGAAISDNILSVSNEIGFAVYLDGLRVVCNHNIIYAGSTNDVALSGGIYSVCNSSQIVNNQIYGTSGFNFGTGILLDGAIYCGVNDNSTGGMKNGIILNPGSDYCRIDGNVFVDIHNIGIDAQAASPVIVNNIIRGLPPPAAYGIRLSGASPIDAIVSNNQLYGFFSGCVATGINLGGLTDLVVMGNRVNLCLVGIDGVSATGMLMGNNLTGSATHTANIGTMTTTGNI